MRYVSVPIIHLHKSVHVYCITSNIQLLIANKCPTLQISNPSTNEVIFKVNHEFICPSSFTINKHACMHTSVTFTYLLIQSNAGSLTGGAVMFLFRRPGPITMQACPVSSLTWDNLRQGLAAKGHQFNNLILRVFRGLCFYDKLKCSQFCRRNAHQLYLTQTVSPHKICSTSNNRHILAVIVTA